KIKPAGDRGQERRGAVAQSLVARRRHAEDRGGVFVLADGEQPQAKFRDLDAVTQIKRGAHHGDEEKIDHPQRGPRPAERREHFRRNIDAGRAAPGFEIFDEGLHALDNADGREGEERTAQAQNSEAEHERQRADADAGCEETRGQRPMMRIDEPDADVAAQAKEHDAAEVDVAGIAQHQIEIAGERDVHGGERQALAHLHVVADERRCDERCDRQRDDPEERALPHYRDPRRAKTPPGKAISTSTNSTNSITNVQLTGTNGVTAPSRRPSATPPISAPTGLPKPPSTVTTKLLS